MPVTVLRLGHRPERDKRVTTHCALAARAFGAREMVYSGVRDPVLEKGISDVSGQWGGSFRATYTRDWRAFIKSFRGKKIHLTMYGTPVEEAPIPKGNVLVVVGAEKVPWEVYEMADMNLAVGSQPHSEIAALSIFLYMANGIRKSFPGANLRIIPQARGKKIAGGKA